MVKNALVFKGAGQGKTMHRSYDYTGIGAYVVLLIGLSITSMVDGGTKPIDSIDTTVGRGAIETSIIVTLDRTGPVDHIGIRAWR